MEPHFSAREQPVYFGMGNAIGSGKTRYGFDFAKTAAFANRVGRAPDYSGCLSWGHR